MANCILCGKSIGFTSSSYKTKEGEICENCLSSLLGGVKKSYFYRYTQQIKELEEMTIAELKSYHATKDELDQRIDEQRNRFNSIIVTTTNTIEGKYVVKYLDVVFGEVVEGINMFRDFAAGFTNVIGGRSESYEKSMAKAREAAMNEMKKKAASLGANAIVGVTVDYEVINAMLMITSSGTAVIVE